MNTCGMKGQPGPGCGPTLHFRLEGLGLERGGVWGPASFFPLEGNFTAPQSPVLPSSLTCQSCLSLGVGVEAVVFRKSLSAHLTRLWSSILPSLASVEWGAATDS